jgi:DNA topoisomerase-1
LNKFKYIINNTTYVKYKALQMPYTLVIVESPAKCKKIEDYLGSGYKCIASFGHIRELAGGLESIDFNNHFAPRFRISENKMAQVEKIKKAIAHSSDILLATDDDREGEAIAWHLCDEFNLNVNTTKRIIFNEITQSALQRAVGSPTTLNMDLVNAQQSRQILDLIVGYKLSPMLWKYINHNSKHSLSAGRCQTPALRLIYDNQKEIEANPGKQVYLTTGYFTNMMLPFSLDYDYEGEEKMGDFLEETVNHTHIITINEPKNTTKNPPIPFTTSAIQQASSNEFKFSPKETMSICQKLYEKGFITYMRTDSTIYSKEFIDKSKEYIKKTYGENYINDNIDNLAEGKAVKATKKKKNDDKQVKAQEAHEAIRPTDINITALPDDMEPKEKKLYRLIWTNTVESCMAPALYKSLSASIAAPAEHKYKYTTEQVIFLGWKIVVGGVENVNPIYASLFAMMNKNGTKIQYKKIVSKSTLKELKSHYTEAKLVQELEHKGIGRPSTFSSLIDKIQERGYVKRENITGKTVKCVDFELVDEEITELSTEREFGNEKNKLVIQPLGVLVLEFLIKHYDALFNYEYTKHMEDSLDHIAKGDKIWHELCHDCDEQIQMLSSQIKEDEKPEPIRIDDKHEYVIGKYGPVIKVKPARKGLKSSFLQIKKDITIDMDKLKRGEYNLEDLIENNKSDTRTNTASKKGETILGKYNEENVILKNGQYGLYVQWGDNRKSLKGIDIEEENITLNDVIKIINKPVTTLKPTHDGYADSQQTSPGLVRHLNEQLSIRKSQYGDYIYYKTKAMTKPKFLKLKGFKGDYLNGDVKLVIDWISTTYSI